MTRFCLLVVMLWAAPVWADSAGAQVPPELAAPGEAAVAIIHPEGARFSNAPGATAVDIPWLKLDVVNHQGNGRLSNVTTVQRINTRGGVAPGTCDQRGSF